MPSWKHRATAALVYASVITSCIIVREPPGREGDANGDGSADELDEGTEVLATVGAAGGRLALPDRAEVMVPESATVEELELRMRELSAARLPLMLPAPAAAPVLELTPHGSLFDTPITIALNYDPEADVDSLAVMRLEDPDDLDWERVDDVRFENGVALFESSTFSYYTVVTFPEPACANPPAVTAACGGTCTSLQYCSSASTCTPIAQNNLCGNTRIYAVQSGESTVDNPAVSQMAAALASYCGVSVMSAALDDGSVVRACSSEVMVGGGNTVVLAGGVFSNPVLRQLDRRISPVFLDTDGSRQQFKTRAGTVLLSFDPASVTAGHDYFMIQIFPDTVRGGLVVSNFGRDGAGTRAGAYYFVNVVVPALRAGTRGWGNYLVVEWTDSGDRTPNAADTFAVRASDPLPPTPPPVVIETPYQSNAIGTLSVGQSTNAAAGYKFTPQVAGKVTALGGYFNGAKTVKLFRGSTMLASTSVTGNNGWVYRDITPVSVNAGMQYTIAVYLAGSGGARRTSGRSLPRTYGSIRIDAPTFANTSGGNANAIPTSNSSPSTTMLGLADIKFTPN